MTADPPARAADTNDGLPSLPVPGPTRWPAVKRGRKGSVEPGRGGGSDGAAARDAITAIWMARPTALVTGASSGLGMQLSRLLAADGHDLVLVARRQDRLDRLASDLSDAHGVDVVVVAMDLAVPGAANAIAERVEAAGRTVDVLVNNAGFGTSGPFWSLDLDRELAMVQVNVSALVHLTGLFLPGMVERRRGHILNIASTAGFQPGPYMATYYATKAFVVSFSEAIAYELRGTGVLVTVHCPGATASEFAMVAGNDRSRLFERGAADVEAVARHAYASMKRGSVLEVHGVTNQVGAFLTRLAPRPWTRGIAAWLNRSGSGKEP